jgi:hypothetical protein
MGLEEQSNEKSIDRSDDKLSSIDIEAGTPELVGEGSRKDGEGSRLDRIWKGMLDVESRSIQPLYENERTNAQPRDNFTLWLSANGT